MLSRFFHSKLAFIAQSHLSYGTFVISALLNALAISLIASRFLFNVQDWSLGQYLYYYTFTFGNFFFISLLLLSLLAYPFALLKLKFTSLTSSIIVNTVLLIFIVADTYVFQMYRLHINLSMIQMTLFGGGQVVQFTNTMLVQIVLMAMGLLLIACANAYVSLNLSQKALKLRFVSAAIALSFLGVNGVYAYAYPIYLFKVLSIHDYIPLDRPIRMTTFMTQVGLLTEEEIDKASQARIETPQGKLTYPLAPIQCQNNSPKPNIIFVFVDALRHDVVNADNMPEVDKFARANTRFVNHYSGGNHTTKGIFTAFYGLPATYWPMALASHTPSALITTLQQQGYDLGIFASSPLTNPEFHATVFASIKDLRTTSVGETVLERDNSALKDFLAWHKKVVQKDKPYFGFVFLDSVHGYTFPKGPQFEKYKPYWETVNHLELNNDFDPKKYFNRYKNAAYYTDSLIGRILKQLKATGALDNTIVVISADHGENFNDQKLNYWGHGGNFTDSEVKIPLVIHWPGKTKGQTVSYMTSSLDVLPTLLGDALKCTNPATDYSVGTSLWRQQGRRDWVFTHGYTSEGFVEKDRIIVVNKLGGLSYYDKNYRPLENETPPAYLSDAIKDMSRFY